MPVVVDTPLIHKSLSAYLLTLTPDANIYDNPNQQGTKIPAWFIVHRSPVSIVREIGRAWLTYEIDLYYMLQLNMTNTFDQYAYIADQMNTSFEYLNIFGTESKIHVLERSWGLQLDCLKYSITLKLRVSRSTVLNEKMRVIEDMQVFLKNQPPEPERYAIVIEPSQNGHVESSSETSIAGQNVTLQVFPDDGYELESLSVMAGETPIPTQQTSEGIVFTMPDKEVTVTAVFAKEEIYAYFTNKGSAETGRTSISVTGTKALYDETGTRLKLEPGYAYTLLRYVFYSGEQAAVPNSLIDRTYFEMTSNSSYSLSVYNHVASASYYNSLVYSKRKAELVNAYVSANKEPVTIGPFHVVYLYNGNGDQISIGTTDAQVRTHVAYYWENGERKLNINESGEPIIRITNSSGKFQVGGKIDVVVEKIEFAQQPIVK
jgi:hypothetical protein